MLLHRSNSTDRLLEHLARRLDEPADPFREDWVIVHSRGLGKWLQQKLADQNGVCGHVRFLLPTQVVQVLLERHLDQPAAPWSSGRLRWSLLFALEDRLGHPAFRQVRRWAEEDGDEHIQRRLAGLAGELAPRFERYALYRADEVAGWDENGEWDHVLWHDLASIEALRPDQRIARARELIAAADVETLPARVAVFTPGSLPPLFVGLLEDLDQRVGVTVHALSANSEHPLVQSLGGQARELVEVLAATETLDDFDAPTNVGLLPSLQRQLLGSEEPLQVEERPSLRVHTCAGDLRQVEVLRDVVHECLAEDEGRQPRDVLVLTPDIERFAPLIKAVFAKGPSPRPWAAGEALPALPFRIADRGLTWRNRPAAALLAAMELLDTRFEVTTLSDLLSVPAVAEHHGLDPQGLASLREHLAEASIHWAADAAHREEHEVPDGEAFTWRRGLDRLLLGQAVGDAEVLDLPAAGDIEDRDGRGALGALCTIADALIGLRTQRHLLRTPTEWRGQLLELLEVLAGTEGHELAATRAAVRSVAEEAPDRPAGWAAVRAVLEAVLRLPEAGRGYLAGGTTVSDMVPMRSVPFSVVCVLGMDDGAFPRTSTEPSFDRIAEAPKPGDRDIRQEDRGLFLETLLCAQDRLELFTTDRSVRDGRERPPATVLAELLEVLGDQATIIEHPLQPHAARRFDGGTWAFDPVQVRAAEAAAKAFESQTPRPWLEAPLEDPEPAVPTLGELESFLNSPTRWFVRKRIGVGWYDRDEELSDIEPLEPYEKGLEEWKAVQAFVKLRLAGVDETRAWQRARDELPLGSLGEIVHDHVAEQGEDLVARLVSARTGRELLAIEHAGLSGTLEVFDGTQLWWTASKFPGQHRRLKPWIRHVAACASGHAIQTTLLGRDSDPIEWEPLSADEARERLEDLLALHAVGRTVPLLFWPEPSSTWLRSRRNEWKTRGDMETVRERQPECAWVLGDDDPWKTERLPVLDGLSFDDLAHRILDPIPGGA